MSEAAPAHGRAKTLILPAVLVTVLAGCASFSPDAGTSAVNDVVAPVLRADVISPLLGRRLKMRFVSLRRAKRSLTLPVSWESGAEASTAHLKARVKPVRAWVELVGL